MEKMQSNATLPMNIYMQQDALMDGNFIHSCGSIYTQVPGSSCYNNV